MAFPTWLIVPAIIVVGLIILFRSLNQVYVLQWLKENFFYMFLIVILVFFAFSLTKLHKTHNLDFTSGEGIAAAGKVYVSWLGTIVKNLGRITGYAAQQEWTTFNVTNNTLPKP